MSLRRSVLRAAPWLVSAALVAAVLMHFDFSGLGAQLRASRWRLLAWATLLNLVGLTFCRVKRFSTLLRELPRKEASSAGVRDLIPVSLAARALNLVLPARAGEALRAVQLSRRFGYPLEGVVAAAAMESVLEAMALALPALIFLSLGLALGALTQVLYTLVLCGCAAFGLALAAGLMIGPSEPGALDADAIHPLRRKIRSILFRMRQSFRSMHGSRTWLESLAWTLSGDAIDVAMIGLCLHAVGISLPPPSWFLVLAGINMALILPAPGNLGTLEAGAVVVLGAMGVDRSQALAFALLYHGAHLLPVLVLGTMSLHFEFPRGTAGRAAA